MKTILQRLLLGAVLAAGLGACYVYDPYYPYGYPVSQVSPQAAFDRYYGAALGAIHDAGMTVTAEDRASGTIQSRRGGTTMNARVITQADGKVRVEFNAGGNLAEDPSLPDRVSRAYEARLGR